MHPVPVVQGKNIKNVVYGQDDRINPLLCQSTCKSGFSREHEPSTVFR
jgi:hypothetical protein